MLFGKAKSKRFVCEGGRSWLNIIIHHSYDLGGDTAAVAVHCGPRSVPTCAEALGNVENVNRPSKRKHDQRFGTVGADDQRIGAVEPSVKLGEARRAGFAFNAPVGAEHGNTHVGCELAASRAGQRDPLG